MSQMKQIPCFVSKRQQKQFNLFNHVDNKKNTMAQKNSAITSIELTKN